MSMQLLIQQRIEVLQEELLHLEAKKKELKTLKDTLRVLLGNEGLPEGYDIDFTWQDKVLFIMNKIQKGSVKEIIDNLNEIENKEEAYISSIVRSTLALLTAKGKVEYKKKSRGKPTVYELVKE